MDKRINHISHLFITTSVYKVLASVNNVSEFCAIADVAIHTSNTNNFFTIIIIAYLIVLLLVWRFQIPDSFVHYL